MPRLIDYADRVEAIREVVYEITLQHGVEAVTLEAVAARLFMAPRTIRRLIASIDALPLLGLQHAERRERQRLLARARYTSWSTLPGSERALEELIGQVPGRDDAADRRVWWLLVRQHAATSEWAAAALAEREGRIAMLSEDLLAGVASEETRAREALKLHFLVSGAVEQVCLGRVGHADAVACIRDQVREVLASHTTRDEAA